jgi:hypothetical protein
LNLTEWFEDEAQGVSETTLAEFDKRVSEYLTVREERDRLDGLISEVNKKLSKMEGKLRNYLEAQGVSSYNTRMGKLIINERTTFKAPEGEERQTVIEKLREDGELENVLGFNAAKFSSWYKAQLETDKTFQLPGVKEDKLVYVSFRKG